MFSAEEIIERYQLEPLDQEGGYFRQIWRSGLRVPNETLCERYPAEGSHPMGTLIHFLMTPESFSAMHRLPTPEHWLYHLGDAAEMLFLHEDGSSELAVLGPDLGAGQEVQITVPMGSWQGTLLLAEEQTCGWTFGSCVMVPGFEWSDFELGDREALVKEYPAEAESIRPRTRDIPADGAL
ncbi:MAG: cupin domain-containing protein [Verrucomicrobiota bacterium]